MDTPSTTVMGERGAEGRPSEEGWVCDDDTIEPRPSVPSFRLSSIAGGTMCSGDASMDCTLRHGKVREKDVITVSPMRRCWE